MRSVDLRRTKKLKVTENVAPNYKNIVKNTILKKRNTSIKSGDLRP